MGLDSVGCCSDSVRLASALVTTSIGNRLRKLFWDGNSSVVWDTRSDTVFGM